MSIITDQINAYRAGTSDFAALVSKLSRRTYPVPARMQGGPKNPFARAVWFDEQPSYSDGTWDEVLRARNYGLLSDDEYNQINAAFEAAHATKDAKYSADEPRDEHGRWGDGSSAPDEAAQKEALFNYQGNIAETINGFLRGEPEYTGNGFLDGQIAAIHAAMQPLPEGTVYRGIASLGVEALIGKETGTFGEKIDSKELHDKLAALAGSVIEDKAFTSTTRDAEVAAAKTNHFGVLAEIRVPAGTRGLDHLPDEKFAYEKETLLDHGFRFHIDGVSDKPDATVGSEFPVYVLRMSVVP